ncbi:Transcription factor 25 [Grifola frondosa]|uniref:Transcription factor 25 n=1 Tax=Grifola frondosa TaxID=5627 RepID=A0A1C7M4P0_GRIFR|nr:Transcription factor 25 [Grifola frondosa]
MSGDPEGFWQLLRYLPYHADTLLQLSEVYFHREEHSTAADFIDRALFTYERAFLGAFNFTSGQNRLDFDRVENRPFFLAIHRQITDLQRRGCVRTAFEFARLLYALDPWTDPHGALLHLDFLAIKAGMGHWLLKVWDLFARQGEKVYAGRLQVTALPGWAYARSLALHANEEANGEVHDASTKALREAILEFPSVVPLLADKADITLSPDVRGQKMFRIYVDSSSVSTEAESILHLLSHLYAQRSFSFWKAPARSSWFAQTVTSVISSVKSPSDHNASHALFTALFSKPALAYSVYRHAIVNESSCRRLFSFIPRSVTNTKHLACDPLPPPTRGSQGERKDVGTLASDPVFRGQLQAFFEAHPHFAQRFPGGILQFAQIAGQLPEDVLEDMMIAEAGIAEQEGRGVMPGQMPGQEMLFADFTDDEGEGDAVEDGPALPPIVVDENEDGEAEEEEEEVAPLPLRFLRTILNRFWGGAAAATGETSEDDDDDAPPHPRATQMGWTKNRKDV